MGHIYKRGNTYWIKYSKNGKPNYETTKSKKEADAKRLLRKCEGEMLGLFRNNLTGRAQKRHNYQ